ncbi:flagellar hook-length control protein FliK [Kluyvera intermedia]|uniref:flagellar hook-length control protein FliK n=1 Tax=Kluyvera intermedia TaxID=61648 RepID=UPI0007890245|nr:flagellar hook-length control protein FliK [Kluyvera intermedia]WQD31357.1 flagellar hook-length control protein FliK [Kluyvera intermedia]VDZ82669.1 Flagellar hook-length control protein [Kluyvera intermedia]
MITLPNLVVSDTQLAGADSTTKAAGSPEDFLALLAETLSQGVELSDVKTKLVASEDTATPRDIKTPGQSLTEWLVSQEATRTTSDSALNTVTPDDAQTLLSSLAAHLKSELAASKENGSVKDAKDDDGEAKLSDDEMKSLSALMAMLPVMPAAQPVPQTTVAATVAQSGEALNTLTASLNRSNGKADGLAESKGAPISAAQTDARAAAVVPAFAVNAQKADTESTPSPAAPTATLAPVASQFITPAGTSVAAATANIHAQLGTPDWQQNVSQHVTLFTRQGQQTAELRLHPESLGQVHITLKVEDNLAQIQMASPHSHVRAALEAALPVLRSQLEESGIQLGQSNISSNGFAGQQQQSSQQSFASRADVSHAEDHDDGDILPVPVTLQSAARGDNAVDIFA